jgi:hypothetical protein
MEIKIENHESIDPQFEDAKVYCIPSSYNLNKLDRSILDLIDSKTLTFFNQSEDYFTKFFGVVNSEILKCFINRLSKLEFTLVVVESGKNNRDFQGKQKGGAYIRFIDPEKESSNWVIDLEPRMYNPDHYPTELLNLMKFGTIKFSYYLDGAQIWKLGNENLVSKYEPLKLELQFLDDLDSSFPHEELRIMYEDYCGSYIFYDNNHDVWYGGMEEAGIFKINLSLSEVIDSIFLTHMKEEYPSIVTIIEGKYLT